MQSDELEGITTAVIQDIGAYLDQQQAAERRQRATLLARYPSLTFTVCSEDDMGCTEPIQSYSFFDLYLVAHHTGGCRYLTQDQAQCHGVLIALHEE